MKTRKFFTIGALAVAVLMSSCNKNETPGSDPYDNSTPASLKITIVGESGRSRGTSEPDLSVENAIHNYTVYVANASTNKVQAVQSFTSGLTNTVTGLTVGEKKVVVVANLENSGITKLTVGQDLSLIDTPTALNLTTQTSATVVANGLLMSGAATVTLTPGTNTISELLITRVVAKVKLAKVTYSPVGTPGTFELNRVLIMKARGQVSYGTVINPSSVFYGGMVGTVSTVAQGFLAEDITQPDNTGIFFYIFPNNDAGNNATLLSIEATYNDKVIYFPIRINDASGIGDSTSDGSFVKRNYIYNLEVTIKRPDNGSPDAETPIDPATLVITVKPVDWESPLTQIVEI